MKKTILKTFDVAIVCSVAVAVFKITNAFVSVIYLYLHQSESCMLTTFLKATAWLPPAIAYIAALFFAVMMSNHLNSKRSIVIVLVGEIAVLVLPLKFSASSHLVSTVEAQAQHSVLPLRKDVPQKFSAPIRLQCYTSTNGIETDKLIFDGDDILEVKTCVSQYNATDLLYLRLIQSASERLQRATSHSHELTRWVVFTTNHVFLANSIVIEPISDGRIYIPMESKLAAGKLAEGISDFLYQ